MIAVAILCSHLQQARSNIDLLDSHVRKRNSPNVPLPKRELAFETLCAHRKTYIKLRFGKDTQRLSIHRLPKANHTQFRPLSIRKWHKATLLNDSLPNKKPLAPNCSVHGSIENQMHGQSWVEAEFLTSFDWWGGATLLTSLFCGFAGGRVARLVD